MIIDDIQWIDPSSLELFQKLASQKHMAGFMLLATCRDDEVDDDHSFAKALTKLKEKKDVIINRIHLGNLSIETVSELVVDHFPTLAKQYLESLSTVLHAHTNRNAFFITQSLHRLKSSGWAAPKNTGKEEGWDPTAEQSMINHLTELDCDALIDIMVSNTANEKPFMKNVMTSASCLGSNFITAHLNAVVNGSTTAEHVWEALSLMETKDFIRPRLDGQGWSWARDKFQKAAYLLIQQESRKLFHLTIGRRLLLSLDEEELQQHLFIVVSQLGLSLKKIKEDEAESVAELFLQAGVKSAQSSSFGKAMLYSGMSMSILKSDNWESQYKLSVRLYSAAAKMECCRSNFGEADKLVTVILRHTRSVKDQLRAHETKIHYLSVQEEHHRAICLALDVMDQLGEKFLRKPGMAKIIYERYAIALLEWNETTEALEYFERAKRLYEEWGSPVKVKQLVKYVEEKSGVTMSIRSLKVDE